MTTKARESHRLIRRNISAQVLADIVGKALPFLTFPFLTRILGPETFGKYGFAVNAAAFVSLLASPGFLPYGIRAAAQKPGEEVNLAGSVNGIRLLFSVAALMVLVLYTFTLAPDDPVIRRLLLLTGLTMIPTALSLDWLLIGKNLIPVVVLAGVVGQVIYSVAILSFIKGESQVWVIPVASLGGILATNLIVNQYARRRFGPWRLRVTRADMGVILPTSLLLGLASLMSLMYNKLDTILLGYFRPMAEVGVYTASYRFMGMVMSFHPILSRTFLPLVAGDAHGEAAREHTSLYFRMLTFAAVPIIAGGMFLSGPLTALVIGEDYKGSDLLLMLLLPNVLLGGLSSFYAGIKLLALNKNREYLAAVTVGGVSNLLLNLVLIPRWGAVAAALTTCLSEFLVASMAAWFGRGSASPPLLGALLKPMGASLVMLVCLGSLRAVAPGTHVLVLVAVGAAVYLSSWYLLRRWSSTPATLASPATVGGAKIAARRAAPGANDPVRVGVLLAGGEKFGPYFGGAVARWTYEVYRRLPGRFEVTVVGHPTPVADRYDFRHRGSRWWLPYMLATRVPLLRRYAAWIWVGGITPRIREMDILHVHNRPGWVPILRRLGYRGRIILHMHNPHLRKTPGDELDLLAGHADRVITCSRFLAGQFTPRSAALAARTGTVYNGVDTARFRPAPGESGRPKTVIYSGRLHPEKGVDVLIRAFDTVSALEPEARLIICGGESFGSDRETDHVRDLKSAAALVNRRHGEVITFTGYQPHDRLPAILQRASIYVCPSRVDDSLPLAAIEAIACGLPVVGTLRGGIPEVVGEAGLLVRSEDPEEMAAAIVRLLRDPQLRGEMSRAALERTRALFDWDIIAAAWDRLLQDILVEAREE